MRYLRQISYHLTVCRRQPYLKTLRYQWTSATKLPLGYYKKTAAKFDLNSSHTHYNAVARAAVYGTPVVPYSPT